MRTSRLLVAIAVVTSILTGCGKDPVKPNPDPGPDRPGGSKAPEITSFSPAKIMPGGEVIIQGKNFKESIIDNSVIFNGNIFSGPMIAATTTQLTVRVPLDATTGKLIVQSGSLKDTTSTDLVIDPDMISLAGFTPATGPIGTSVTITGINFGLNTRVKINGVECPISNRTNTSLTISIPLNTSLSKHKFEVINGPYNLQTPEEFTVSSTGATARWDDKQIELVPNGASVFHDGLSFVHGNKLYWGFTRLVPSEQTSLYAVYDPAQPAKGWQLTDKFSQTMAPAGLSMATAIVHNDRVYLGTGFKGNQGTPHWWEFNPADGSARQLTDFPHPAPNTISFVLNNRIYVGFGSGNKNLYEFDPAGNNNLGSWTLKATHNLQELNSGNAFVLGNEVIIGRALPELNKPRLAMLKYTEGGQLTRIPDMPQDIPSGSTASFTIGNKGYFVINKNVWEYTPDAAGGSWRVVAGGDQQPAIKGVGTLTINGVRTIYGWTGAGHLYEFKL
ncbi:IPT/TIG domain-containing protein [Paraflavitalea pollutisoli]|uniref:IPT/TIG domain-containing protein n=1 Tax=Paraflavitalea pollutisoli TaxID=3034143 RepID=UPI0023EC5954|nr:IPT/TIG domain-containing protein [Paraflavitalea sp. H1-2-19X]